MHWLGDNASMAERRMAWGQWLGDNTSMEETRMAWGISLGIARPWWRGAEISSGRNQEVRDKGSRRLACFAKKIRLGGGEGQGPQQRVACRAGGLCELCYQPVETKRFPRFS